MQVFCSILAWNVKPEPNQEEASENPKLDAFHYKETMGDIFFKNLDVKNDKSCRS